MYGLCNRPDLPQSIHRYGVIETDRPLTPQECDHFDLTPIGGLTMATTVETIMRAHGYDDTSTGGGCYTWWHPTDDASVLWICTVENSLDGDPDIAEWYVGRHSQDDGGFIQCSDFLTLADALALAPRIPSPVRRVDSGEVQLTLSRAELERG
jgi:hypothetical protein